jgi:hypothetical protein
MKRIIKIVAVTVLVLVAAFALYVFVIYPATWQSTVTKESTRILEAAQTTNELAKAVGDLGAFYALPDGAWVAIRYRDCHSGGVFSSAVARDSGGKWFHSTHHFCGYLQAYGRRLAEQRGLDEAVAEGVLTNAPNVMAGFEGIHALATSPDLGSARKNLTKLGFQEFQK